MEVKLFFDSIHKQKSIYGTLCAGYYGTFSEYRIISDKFIVVQLYKFISASKSNIAERIISISGLERMPDALLDDYLIMVISELENVMKGESWAGDSTKKVTNSEYGQ